MMSNLSLDAVGVMDRGFAGLKLLYGEHNIKMMADDGFPWFTVTKPVEFWKRVMGNEKINFYTVINKLRLLAIAFYISREIGNKSRKNPDILQGNGAKAFW